MYTSIQACRLCFTSDFDLILDLGSQAITSRFPKSRNEIVPSAPLHLVRCKSCELVQLGHSYDLRQVYTSSYGYRSGLNAGMVRHLTQKVASIVETYSPQRGDLIVDIGSNDATLLKAYPDTGFMLVGVDPSGYKFKEFYPPSIQLIPDFFSSIHLKKIVGNKKARVITTIAVLYDLEDPVGFAQEVSECLADDGVWVFEQSYLPTMLERTSYDTICHEHLEYYALKQIKAITDQAGLKILNVEFNEVNGGSFAITAAKKEASYPECTGLLSEILTQEQKLLNGLEPYLRFSERAQRHRNELNDCLWSIKARGQAVIGYGASTKGNVILQYCNLTEKEIPFIAEVNTEKYGAFTPGSLIPIISEAEAHQKKPDYFFVLPWHFRTNIIAREKAFFESGGQMMFPLPRLEIVSS